MRNELRDQQQAWARYIRDPSQPVPAGIDPARMALYRSLCIGSVEGVLDGSFPRLQEALGRSTWSRIVTEFHATHRCETPLFPELGGEFITWLLGADGPVMQPAWAEELAHFEWMSQQLLLAPSIPYVNDTTMPTIDTPLHLSPLARIAGYRWPVHRTMTTTSTDAIPPAEPTLLLLRRTRDHSLRITTLSLFDYSLLLGIADEPNSMRELLARPGDGDDESVSFAVHSRELLKALYTSGVVLPIEIPVHPDARRALP